MEEIIYVNCPLCGSEKRLQVSSMDKEEISKCVSCGVVYKNIVNTYKTTPYSSEKTWEHYQVKNFFADRSNSIKVYLEKNVKFATSILEIGCATGKITRKLFEIYPESSISVVEPSEALLPFVPKQVNIYHDSFDFAKIEGKFDLIICTAVDYLFYDHAKCMDKIRSLMSESAFFYIERGIFDKYPLWKNSLVNTWFTRGQFKRQIKKYFEIIDKVRYGNEMFDQLGYLCILKK